MEFPLDNSLAVVAPYWDDSILSGSRQLRYQVVSGSSPLITEVNAFLSNYTGDTFEADWLLWAYWHDVCPYNRRNCQDVCNSKYCYGIITLYNFSPIFFKWL